MAIIQDREPDGLRFGSVQNLMQESIVHEGYVRDMIHNYGLDIRYYKLKLPYPDTFKPILDSNNLSAHAYGEAFVQEWEDPVRMIAYIKWDQDSVVLNAWGAIPESNMTMWIDQTDFAISFASKLAQWKEYKVVGHSEFILDFDSDDDMIRNRDNIMMEFKTDLFDGSLQAVIDDKTLDKLVMHDSCPKLETPITIPCRVLEHGNLKIDTGRINPLLYKGGHYDPFEDEMVEAHLHLEVVSILKDKHGCIKIMGGIRGAVIYHDTTLIGKYIDKVKPEVGDLIDVPVPGPDGTEQVYNTKYEIVHLEETITQENFMNPFLRKYIWQINLRRYIPSGQKEPGDDSKTKQDKDKLDLISQAAEDAAKKIGLYEDFEDDVYGGYQRINKRTTASVQRDQKNSTINKFEPQAKDKKKEKTTTPLFVFKDWDMVLSLVSDPKNNESHLTLTPRNKSTEIENDIQFIENLRIDDDNFCLVDETVAYLLASRFTQMELDDNTYCLKPIRLKHEVYAQHNGWVDQPFHQVDAEDDVKLNMNLQDMLGPNTTSEWKSASENRITFPTTNSYLEVEYEKPDEGMEVWTCFAVLDGDKSEPKTHFPICAYIKNA